MASTIPDAHFVPLDSDKQRSPRLAAEGLTNDQIAERLIVSPRTVERHLSNIYRKLGVSGRSARAAAVEHLLRG